MTPAVQGVRNALLAMSEGDDPTCHVKRALEEGARSCDAFDDGEAGDVYLILAWLACQCRHPDLVDGALEALSRFPPDFDDQGAGARSWLAALRDGHLSGQMTWSIQDGNVADIHVEITAPRPDLSLKSWVVTVRGGRHGGEIDVHGAAPDHALDLAADVVLLRMGIRPDQHEGISAADDLRTLVRDRLYGSQSRSFDYTPYPRR